MHCGKRNSVGSIVCWGVCARGGGVDGNEGSGAVGRGPGGGGARNGPSGSLFAEIMTAV